jgi:hypothetical protein
MCVSTVAAPPITAGLDARMWCERAPAAAGNVMPTGVRGEVEEEQRQH